MKIQDMKSSFSPGLILILATFMLLLSGLALWFLGRGEHLESAFVRDSQKVQLVTRMRADLYAAAEAEKSAVLAETDAASQDNAKRAQDAADQVAADLKAFKPLSAGDPEELQLLRRFEDAFAEYRKVDEEVLALAVQNTNLKAYALSFGQASEALAKMELALGPVLSPRAKSGKATEEALYATRALAEALRIQTLHAPHIAERTTERMNGMEQRMTLADKGVRADLSALGASGTAALAAYEDFHKTTTEIIRLSRLNTNVHSLDLSLGRKVQILALCDNTLQALKDHVSGAAAKATK
ncbi:MAG: MCP four helix bundle domain-containing protein [Humidesulfovibrio sp.]|nr:MCP four helix bundle domain-containing protein [Humidesulfovibrio sp.]